MAGDIGGLPYWEIRFDKDGKLLADDGLTADVAAGRVHQLFFMAHGWNNSVTSAQHLCQDLFGRLSRLLAQHAPDQAAGTGVVVVLWPSLVLPEDDPTAPVAAGAASASISSNTPKSWNERSAASASSSSEPAKHEPGSASATRLRLVTSRRFSVRFR